MNSDKQKTKTVSVFQVDAFTDQKFKGNPAGVVLEADILSDAEMQCIARELNNSETAFLLQGNGSDHDLHIRYFTPTIEVPICGHATIASMYVHALQQRLSSCTVRIKTKVGVLPISINEVEGNYYITMEQAAPVFEPSFDQEMTRAIAEALGTKVAYLSNVAPVQIVSTGHSKVMIPMNDVREIDQLQPNMSRLAELSTQIGCNGYFVFAVVQSSPEYVTYGRMFAPAIGIAEDPVTGNANGPLGAYLLHHHLVKPDDSTFQFTATQGNAVRRPGKMKVMVDVADGKPSKVKIEGTAVIVFSTSVEL